MPSNHQKPVIFFDGLCNLCNGAVQFALRHEKNDAFRYTALQGQYAKKTLAQFKVNPKQLNSILLIDNGKLYFKSTAALRITKKFKGLWPALYLFILVPAFIRNWVYDIIAKNRYKWFGKKESCWVPTPALKAKFLD